ncbi:uncharacterized protein LOC125235278 [Leguminivora glycinivorella]|uniref:uncharacterized protein LOC125235278 n=1 Tax=Leguminivora glycinivorella TaxID=1035111 RepID=UPI00200C9320|nr:uncharacterized protein LOC125235278 [Leguminivora glycinivorella]
MDLEGKSISKKIRNPFETLLKMRRETPEFRRCCFCIPLRRGLITWGYLRAALDLLAMSLVIYILTAISILHGLLITEIVVLIIDVVFNIMLIVGGHLKSIKLLKVNYYFSLAWLGLLVLGFCWQIYSEIRLTLILISYGMEYGSVVGIALPGLSVGFVQICLQIYLILLIRSEIIKLQEQNLEMQFSNPAVAEAQCTMHIAA